VHMNKYRNLCMFFLLTVFTIHMDTIDKTRKTKVSIIDSGINYRQIQSDKLCTVYGSNVIDTRHHGQFIFDIISSHMHKGQCAYVFRVFAQDDTNSMQRIVKAINVSIQLHVDIINMSYSGGGFSDIEYQAIKRAIDAGIKIVVAAGNNGMNLDEGCSVYPTCYSKLINNKNFIVVGSVDFKGGNKGKVVDVYAPGHYNDKKGTSISAANVTANILKEL